MEVIDLPLEGLKLIKLKSYHDNRGFFTERFNVSSFKEHNLPTVFPQDNFSRSAYGVLRGLHFQNSPAQGKLVTCLSGEIFDVAVDIRPKSSTYGQHIGIHLNGNEPSWLWIPNGFAHGFCVISQTGADVIYKVDALYSPAGEGSFRWNSPELNISWPISNPILSPKDEQAPIFSWNCK